MKTLADAICQSISPELGGIRDLLVKPAVNHSSERPFSFVDRFTVSNAKTFIENAAVLSETEYSDYIKMARPILPIFWLEWEWECTDGPLSVGALIENNRSTLFCKLRGLNIIGYLGMGSMINGSVDRQGSVSEQSLVTSFNQLFVLLTACNSPHASTTEKSTPQPRQVMLRKFQRGVPTYSHNIITLTLPQPSDQRHETRAAEHQGIVRAHWVRGHWRLIIPANEHAFFVWVEGHRAGNEALGSVTKEHKITLGAALAARKGMLVPSHEGSAGEHVRAYAA